MSIAPTIACLAQDPPVAPHGEDEVKEDDVKESKQVEQVVPKGNAPKGRKHKICRDDEAELTENSESEREGEDDDDSKKKKKRRPFAHFEMMANKSGVSQIHLTCKNKECKHEFDAEEVETTIKVHDVLIGSEDIQEMELGHLMMNAKIIFKRRTFVFCPECHQRHFLANEALDHDFGQVLGDVIDNCMLDTVAGDVTDAVKQLQSVNHFTDVNLL